ncbi:GNAT family N-acetyltransferase [Streptomyces sp. 7R007]
MPSTNAGADTPTATATTATDAADPGAGPGSDPGLDPGPGHSVDAGPGTIDGGADQDTDGEDTLDLRLPDELIALIAQEATADGTSGRCDGMPSPVTAPSAPDDLLDGIADWGPTATPVGVFQLVPVHIERDLPLISRWMNDPAVSEFWELAGAQSVTENHVRSQLTGDGRSIPCLGVLEGTPMSYWEIYRADLDPLARFYPARPHDTGIHLLIGSVTDRGRGLGSALLRAVADLALDKRPACARVLAEPDLRNTPSIAAFLSAGFRFSAEVDLPAKRAALMIRDRTLRDVL